MGPNTDIKKGIISNHWAQWVSRKLEALVEVMGLQGATYKHINDYKLKITDKYSTYKHNKTQNYQLLNYLGVWYF